MEVSSGQDAQVSFPNRAQENLWLQAAVVGSDLFRLHHAL